MLDSAEFVTSPHHACLYTPGRRLARGTGALSGSALFASRAIAGRTRCFAAISRDFPLECSIAPEHLLDRLATTPRSGVALLHLTAIAGRSLTLVRRLGRGDDVPVVIATGLEPGDAGVEAMRQVAIDTLDTWFAQTAAVDHESAREQFVEAEFDHSRAISILAHTCSGADVSGTAFLVCAEAIAHLNAPPLEVAFTRLSPVIRGVLESPPFPCGTASDLRVRTVIDALQSGANQALHRSLFDWARLLAVDAAHLGRLLHAQTGLRFREWRRAYRMKRAAHLLTRDDEQVAQIAFAVGFNDNSQFGREFRELFGFTPRAFRSLLRAPHAMRARHASPV
jgi:AraC-like DNA-binding protein